ncbi:MAG: mannose-6-phosphate isomerase, class I [Deltaproteobacteria bacterium]|nr:mannose-6-phosphate isomerase, class I [Deltaproteobacteria bacterium]
MDGIQVLKNPIQNYAWGSKSFIPQLMGASAPENLPQAELWMGAHPKAPSLVWHNGGWVPLPKLIRKDPEGILGRSTAKKFSNSLPFLFKVLAVEKPLSIQAHPNRDQARRGFSRENSQGIPLDAPHRNYKDVNHKPEIICALTPFWALTGFREMEKIVALAHRLEASRFRDRVMDSRGQTNHESLRRLFTGLLKMDRDDQHRMVAEVVKSCEEHAGADKAFDWTVKLNRVYPGDASVLSPLIMEIVRLEPGEALYISSGRIHSYLEGAGIELMANSDNVLRGGLTPKNIDLPELLEILDFSANQRCLFYPERGMNNEKLYRSPAEEFMLSAIFLDEGAVFVSPNERSVEIMICTEGEARITDLDQREGLSLNKGTSIMIPASTGPYKIKGKCALYKASVPL